MRQWSRPPPAPPPDCAELPLKGEGDCVEEKEAEAPLRRSAPLAPARRVEICHRQQVVVFPQPDLVEN